MYKTRDNSLRIWFSDDSNRVNRLLYNKYRNKTNKHINTVSNVKNRKEVCNSLNNSKKYGK